MPRGARKSKYNEQFFRHMGGPGPTLVGAAMVLLIVFGLYMAFAKKLPFTDRGYELNATFSNAANIRTTSPVRIAGVNVGEVIEVNGDGACELYRHLKEQAPGDGGDITWNFEKFLVGRDGTVIKRYPPMTTPEEIGAELAEHL